MPNSRYAPKHSAKSPVKSPVSGPAKGGGGRLSPEQFQLRQRDDPLARKRAARAATEQPNAVADPFLDAARHILSAHATQRDEPLDTDLTMVAKVAKTISESTLTPDQHWPDLFDTLKAPDEHGLTWRIKPAPVAPPPSSTSPSPASPANPGSSAGPPGIPTNTGTVIDSRDGRRNLGPQQARDFVRAINPTGRAGSIAKVKAQVVEVVLATGATGADSLRRLTTICYAFALWCLANSADGKFVPARDFNEDSIHDFITHGLHGVTEGTKSTYRSEVRRLGGNRNTPHSIGRRRAQQPYPATVARGLWVTSLEFEDWEAVEMRTLLALTLGAGARANEINQMRADQVTNRGNRLVVELVRDGGVVREVPVYGEQAQWLRERASQLAGDAYLLRPGFKTRRNAISDIVAKAAALSDVFQGFKTVRARHTWICHYLNVGMNFGVLCQAADVGEDSNLFADLAPYLPPVTAADIRREFDRAHKSTRALQESA